MDRHAIAWHVDFFGTLAAAEAFAARHAAEHAPPELCGRMGWRLRWRPAISRVTERVR